MINREIQQHLRNKFNPDGSQLRKLQLEALKILEYIDKVCIENNINYWISSGTCLGAIRHGGFIPWDDDIDIEILKKDYKKFKQVITKQNLYKLQDYKTDNSYFFRFAKIRNENIQISEIAHGEKRYKYNGIYIDVFLMEYSSSLKINKLGWPILYLLNFKLNKIIKQKNLVNFLAQLIIQISRLILRPLQCIGRKKYLRHVTPSAYSKGRDPKSIFPTKRIKFENIEVNAPGNPDLYLKNMFGDYERIPEKIHTHDISIIKLK